MSNSKRLAVLLLVLAILCAHTSSGQIGSAAAKAVGKTLAGSGAAKAVGKALAKAGPWIAGLFATAGGAAVVANVVDKGEAVYAVQFVLDKNASSIYWARWVGWPNIFPVLQVEGMGEYVIPEIFRNYNGGTIIWTFKIPKIPANRAVSLHVLDDRSTSNEIWNNILRTRWSVKLSADVTVTKGISVAGNVGGDLQLLDHKITIIGPRPLCNYTVSCPDPWFGSLMSREWHTEGNFRDSDGNNVGVIRLSQLFNK